MTTAVKEPTAGFHDYLVEMGKSAKALGYICFYSIPDKPVTLPRLKKQWLLHGLDPSMLPPDPRALYIFKRAVRAQEGKVKIKDGRVVETLVKDVAEDADFCIYQVSRVVRDKNNRVVDFPKALRVTFVKKDQLIDFDALIEKGSPVKRADLFPLEEAISDYFDNNSKMIDGRKVRTLVRNFLRDDNDEQSNVAGLSGENLRGKAGGVYFIAERHKDSLTALSDALAGLYADGEAYLYSIPLPDGPSGKEMIRKRHIENAKREIDEAINDVRKLLREDRKNKIRSDVREHWWRKLRALQRRAADYKAMLEDDGDDVEIALKMMERQINKLASK